VTPPHMNPLSTERSMATSNPPPNQLLGFLRRHVVWIVVSAVAAGAAAFMLAPRFSATTWTCTGTLLYNRTMLGAPHYQQPEVQSIMSLVKSRPVIEATAREVDMLPAMKYLADSVTVDVLPGSSSLQFSMRGDDPQRTSRVLDRLMNAVVVQAGAIRRTTISQILAAQERHLADAKRTVDEAQAGLSAFNARHQIVTSVADDLERVRDDVAAVELAVETERTPGIDPQTELARRRSAIAERMNHQRETIIRSSDLELKKNEFERAARLHARRYISDAEFRRVEAEFRALEAQQGAAMQGWNRRLADLDHELTVTAADGDPVAAARRHDAEIAQRIRSFVARRRGEADRLNGLRAEAAELAQNLATAVAEVQRVETLRAGYAELEGSDFRDLTVVQAAAPSLDPATSTQKKVMAGLFVGAFLLLLVPAVVRDLFRTMKRAPADAGDDLYGLPLVAAADAAADASSHSHGASETARTAALRIQQLPTERAAAVLLAPLDDVDVHRATVDVAECLVRRGERVLVVDCSDSAGRYTEVDARFVPAAESSEPVVDEWLGAGTGRYVTEPVTATARFNSAAAGSSTATLTARPPVRTLVDLLLDSGIRPSETIRRGRTFDRVAPDARPLPPEACASRRLSELLDASRDRYSAILVVGPQAERTVDVEMLAARADAVLFVARNAGARSPGAARTVAGLAALRAPVLGAIVV
jgi:hypothetical protein